MPDITPADTTYLEEAAVILRSALKSAEDRYNNAPYPRVPEDHRALLEARVRIAEGFARLHEAGRVAPADPQEQNHA